MAGFESLPLDLGHEIIAYLDISSFFALKSATSRLHSFIQFDELPSVKRIEFLRAADHFPQNKELLACFHCCKMLPKASFGMNQRKGSRGKVNRNSSRRPVQDRFCLDCGARERLYGHMNPVIIRRAEDKWLLCHVCGRYGTRYRQCGPARARQQRQHTKGGDDEDEWVCWSEDTYGAPTLDKMPPEIIHQVVAQLAYPDAIRLSGTCLALRKTVDLDRVLLHDRFRFLCHKEAGVSATMRIGIGNGDTKSMACYACFRLRPASFFSNEQNYLVDTSGKIPFWQRRCRHCLYKMHANKDGEKRLESWSRQVMCDSCGLLKLNDSDCQGCLQQEGLWNKSSVRSSPQQPAGPADHHVVACKVDIEGNETQQRAEMVNITRDGPQPILRLLGVWAVRATEQARRNAMTPWSHAPRLRRIKAGRGDSLTTRDVSAMQVTGHHVGLAA